MHSASVAFIQRLTIPDPAAPAAPVRVGRPVLAVASAGGHWEQLMMMRAAWADEHIEYATTLNGLGKRTGSARVHLVPDCNRNSRLAVVRSGLAILVLLVRVRPRLVLTTGALPGLLALILAKRLRIRTVWIDSVANAAEISLAGKQARRHADLWLTQWPDVAARSGARYCGSVL